MANKRWHRGDSSCPPPMWPGACFSKVPKLFRRTSADIILFVSSKRRRLEARNFAVIFFLFPLQHVRRSALQNKQVVVLRMAFRAPGFEMLTRCHVWLSLLVLHSSRHHDISPPLNSPQGEVRSYTADAEGI